MVTRSVPAKRKQAVDSTESPPKRVTRARAAKAPTEAEEVKEAVKAKATTISAKTATTKKKAATVPPRTTKRKTRAENEENIVASEEADVEADHEAAKQEKTQPTKSKGAKTRKTPRTEETKSAPVDEPKPRSRQARAVKDQSKTEVSTTRGARKRGAAAATEEVGPENTKPEEVFKPAPVKRTTRGKAAATTASKIAKPTAATNTNATKKKVQFQDEQDKENIPIQTEGPRKSAMKATGMKAKPVRKPAAPRGTTRGKKAVSKPAEEATSESSKELPLSPKKVTQVAKTPSSSEDELSGEKTPVRSLSKSPMKNQASPAKLMQSPLKQRSDQSAMPISPSIQFNASVLTSPAKKPPQSPFKDSMRSSPKKFNFANTASRPAFSGSQVSSPTKTSLLQESPRKVKIANESANQMLPPSHTPFKPSLLQSPARRLNSPLKATATASAVKSFLEPEHLQATPRRAALFSPSKPLGSARNRETSPVKAVESTSSADDMNLDGVYEQSADIQSSPIATRSISHTLSSPLAEMPVDSVGPYENEDEMDIQSPGDIAPPATTNANVPLSFDMTNLRKISGNSQLSEDELASPDKRFAPTPLRRQCADNDVEDTPVAIFGGASMTPLADRLNGWLASSPNKQRPSRQQRGIFSLPSGPLPEEAEQEGANIVEEPPTKSSFFEDDMAVLDVGQQTPLQDNADHDCRKSCDVQASMESQASQEYGDENVVPVEAQALRAEQEADDPTLTCTPAKVFTPAKQVLKGPREVYTVSKVPLRPSGETSPLKIPRQRSKSLGGALAVLAESSTDDMVLPDEPVTPKLSPIKPSHTPSSGMKLDCATPGRTGRKGGASTVLQGAVVYVDVHTSEGADASGIFVDLLTQMGARCVKQWNWNPRASLGAGLSTSASPQDLSPNAASSASKVGITHVVYKDGGVRTLEKVRLSDGLVLCVGVGWVLDCEREDAWLDEANYAIDLSNVPRGGHRRRKSMEPRALANLEGSLVPAESETPAKANQISPTKEFLALNTPASRRDTFVLETEQVTHAEAEQLSMLESPAPATPDRADDSLEGGFVGASPTTPFYLSKGAELVQRTCPPKQKGERLFPASGNVEDEPDEEVRRRLVAARRKTLQWSSKTKSPLGRTVSYEI